MAESAESHEDGQTDGRPPTKKGRPPARQTSLRTWSDAPASASTPERVTEVLRLGPPEHPTPPATARAVDDPTSRNDERRRPTRRRRADATAWAALVLLTERMGRPKWAARLRAC